MQTEEGRSYPAFSTEQGISGYPALTSFAVHTRIRHYMMCARIYTQARIVRQMFSPRRVDYSVFLLCVSLRQMPVYG